jgi:hypothetical protein
LSTIFVFDSSYGRPFSEDIELLAVWRLGDCFVIQHLHRAGDTRGTNTGPEEVWYT